MEEVVVVDELVGEEEVVVVEEEIVVVVLTEDTVAQPLSKEAPARVIAVSPIIICQSLIFFIVDPCAALVLRLL